MHVTNSALSINNKFINRLLIYLFTKIQISPTLCTGLNKYQFISFQNAGPDITWIDSQRPIFTVAFQLISTVFTRDPHLYNLFAHAERILDTRPSVMPSDTETCKILKAAHAIQLVTAITFLPTILNQLFTLLTYNIGEEVGLYIIRVLIHIINMIHEAGRKEILQAYIKVKKEN